MQIIIIHYHENIQWLFACNIVLDADHHYHGNIQRLFLLQIVVAANHHYLEIIQKLFWLQNCLNRKSSLCSKLSKTFFAGKSVFDANHHYAESIQRLFRLQNCLSRKSSLCWTYSKTFSPAKKSSTQITIILKIFKDFFACKIVLAANHLYLENIQRLFWLQKCLSRKSSLS